MNKLLEVNQDIRNVKDPHYKSRELYVRRIMETYGQERDAAERTFEYMRLKQTQFLWGCIGGSFVLWFTRPHQQMMRQSHWFFRKRWMGPLYPVLAFCLGYYAFAKLPYNVFYNRFLHPG